MVKLLFTPRTTIEANIFQYRLDNSDLHGEWNAWTGCYEFLEDEDLVDNLEEIITSELAFDIDGRFELESDEVAQNV